MFTVVAEDTHIYKVPLIPSSPAGRFSEKLRIVILGVTFLLRSECFASRIDPHEHVDNVAKQPINFNHRNFISGDRILPLVLAEPFPVDPPDVIFSR